MQLICSDESCLRKGRGAGTRDQTATRKFFGATDMFIIFKHILKKSDLILNR